MRPPTAACTAPGARRIFPPTTSPVPMSGRRGAVLRRGVTETTASFGSVPVITSSSVAPGHRTARAPVAATAELAMGHSRTYSSRWDRWRRKPSAPRPSTATRTRLRQPSPAASPGRDRFHLDGPARARPGAPAARLIRNAFRRRWAPTSTCWKSQPPQRPGPACGHGGSTRSGDAGQDLDGIGPQVRGRAGGDPGPDPLAGEAVADEDHLAVGGTGHTAPAGRDGAHLELQKARTLGGRHGRAA